MAVAFLLALSLALALTPVVRRLALAVGALDRPGERSVHGRPVPFLGGVAIFLAFAAAAAYAVSVSGLQDRSAIGILIGGTFILLFGIVDDYVAFSPKVKLLGQVAAALILIAFGVKIDYITNPLGEGLLPLGDWTIPLTIIWVVAVVNVMNLIDGLDGLAAGIAFLAAVTLTLSAWQLQQPATTVVAMLMAAALAGSVLGFLPYNFYPARIFMGDGGSMFVGFALAAVSVEGSLKSPAAMTLAVPVLALGLPILDTLLAILRRWRQRRPIGQPDREHFHHRLLQLGLSQREAALVMYLASGWLGISALAVTSVNTWLAAIILGLVALTMGFVVWKVGMLTPRQEQEPLRPRFSRLNH